MEMCSFTSDSPIVPLATGQVVALSAFPEKSEMPQAAEGRQNHQP